jgi:acyl-coenzyme A thioesterase PaaI-like protein
VYYTRLPYDGSIPAETPDVPSGSDLDAIRLRAQPIPLDAAERGRWQERMNALPGMLLMGARVDLSDGAVVRLTLASVGEQHLGGLGTRAVNGAVIAGMFDAALGVAGTLQFPGQRAGTIELAIKLMRPAFEAPLEVLGVAVRRTAHLAFTEAELHAGGRRCASASGIVAVASSPKEGDDYW